ncbi:hypothetical protein AB0399_17895 [Streptomyces sp. NPDC088194]|uniref:hypothetical protein n=1 Tax=Streptomyces sp. NPDC088194 TaxID=3154931 RepID=UPI00344E02A7
MLTENTTAAGRTELVRRLIPDLDHRPASIEQVSRLPSFLSVLRACEQTLGTPYSAVDHEVQDTLVLRRLQQMVHTVRLNPLWRERLAGAGVPDTPATYDEWQRVPLADKDTQRELFMGERPGLVVPLTRGGFEIVASGGTSGGLPVETVYSLRELQDTYRLAGDFIGRHMLAPHLTGDDPKWLFTTLADYQMWSSGTMVGGVLQSVPGVNYIGAGPVGTAVIEQMFSYPGPKALMGITAGIAILTELGAGMSRPAKESFRVAMYGSGVLARRKRAELKAMYPNLSILSYFAATQAETIGLQLSESSAWLAAVPGLHLVEIVDDSGRWVPEGAEGELVVTRLHAHEAPLLRLKLGDRMIRRPRTDEPGLRTQRFEFAGRSGDVLHLGDTQYAAARAYAALRDRLRAGRVLDLDEAAHDVQFVNHRESKLLTLLAAVDDVPGAAYRLDEALGAHGVQRAFAESLPLALSVYNQWEADPVSIAKSGYRFDLRFVPRDSPEIEHTAVGKVPLVRDVRADWTAR